MQIQLLNNQVTTQTNSKGKPMQVLEVAYKNLTFNGKVESKKLFDFGVQAEAFKTLVTASPTMIFDIDVVKNSAGYNDWVKVTKGSVDTGGTVSAPAKHSNVQSSTQGKGNWETPEERVKKQVYIVRQSSLSVAATALTASAKAGTQPTAEELIALAKQLEAYVFDTEAVEDTSTGIESMDEEIPF